MQFLSIPCLMMASINFYVGASYLFFHLKRPQIRVHLPFALLCFSVGLYDLFCVGLYNSHNLFDGIFWQHLQFDGIAAISICMIWFTGSVTGQNSSTAIRCLIAWFVLLLVVSQVAGPELTLSPAHPAVKQINLFSLPAITYHEAAPGPIYQGAIVSAIAAYAYLCHLFLTTYRRTRQNTLLVVLACQLIYFLAVLNDSLIGLQFYQFIYVSEYAFFFIVLSMAFVLLNQFMDLHTEFEALNASLEQQVEEQTQEIRNAMAQMKTLEGIIPICAYCKKIRDDQASWHQLEQYISDHSDASFTHGICPACLDQQKLELKNMMSPRQD